MKVNNLNWLLFLFSLSTFCAAQNVTKKIIVSAALLPMINCTVGESDEEFFVGFGFEYFKLIAEDLQWSTAEYAFECVNYEDVEDRIKENKNVTLALNEIIITSDWLEKNFKFSFPLYSSRLKLLVRKEEKQNLFSFLTMFSTNLWLMILLTTFVMGILTWIYEERNFKGRKVLTHLVNFQEILYDTASSFFYLNEIKRTNLASKIIQVCFWFMVLVFVAMYTADLTGKLTENKLDLTIQSIGQAERDNVKLNSLSKYERFVHKDLNVDYVNITDPSTFQVLVDKLIDRDIDGVFADGSYIESATLKHFNDVAVAGDEFAEFNYGLLFPTQADPNLVKNITASIFKLREDSRLRTLMQQNYINTKGQSKGDAKNKLEFRKLAGLWIILGVAITVRELCDLFIKVQINFGLFHEVGFNKNYTPLVYDWNIVIAIIGHVVYKYVLKKKPVENLSPYLYPDVIFENTQICNSIEFEFGKLLRNCEDAITASLNGLQKRVILPKNEFIEESLVEKIEKLENVEGDEPSINAEPVPEKEPDVVSVDIENK